MDNSRLAELGLVKVCRACLSDEGNMKTVFGYDPNDQEQLYKKFEMISSLQITESDGFPTLICYRCELQLASAFEFRRQCQQSHATLQKYIDNALQYNLKKETQENDLNNAFDDEQDDFNMKLECTTVIEESPNNDGSDENSPDDLDDKPLSSRRNSHEPEPIHFTADLVGEAIEASKRRYNETRECRLCGFMSSNARGLSLHISHLHKELKDRWCGICYQEVDDLSTHLKDHAKSKSYVCTFCGKGFSSQSHLSEHIRSHSTERPYKCKDCGKGFLSARHLKVHDRIHSGEKPYSCLYCGRRFTQNGSLQGHIRTHTGLKPYQCEVCEKKYTTSSALAAHRSKSGHVSPTKYINPNTCDSSVDDSKEEVKSADPLCIESYNPVKNNAEKRITVEKSQASGLFGDEIAIKKLCTVCGKTFSTASKLRLHMRVHTGETPYKCSVCDKRFSTRGQMVVHVRTHTGEKPHVCCVCGKGFAQSSVLNTHMKLHTGRPEVCQICQQRFCRPAELRLHMRKHTGERPFLCTECGQAFIQRSHLMEHVKIHTDERPYKCNICERAFKQSSSLKSHIQIHTGQKPYQCSQCPYACRQSYALTQHMKQHSGDLPQADKPHECMICHKTFTTLAMLNSHTRTTHNAMF